MLQKKLLWIAVAIALGSALGLGQSVSSRPDDTSAPPRAVFTLNEEFGVSHPEQVVDFDFSGSIEPGQSYMIGPEGNEVPFQRLSGNRIAVRTNLPASSKKHWQLFSGRAPKQLTGGVTLTRKSAWFEITNGLTGVRVARPDAVGDSRLAPIQGVELRNGVWSAPGPNYLLPPGTNLNAPPLRALTASAKVVEEGPLEVVIEVDYAYARPPLVYANRTLIPGGPGFYRSRICLEAGSPSIRIEEDADIDLQYILNFYNEVQPDQGRYRGHHSSAVAFGHEPDGGIYRPVDRRPAMDAVRDFSYDVPIYSSYITGEYKGQAQLQRMGLWNPWIFDSGWYWMTYKRAAPADGPVLGIFPGPASFLIGAGDSGPGLTFLPRDNKGQRLAGICFQTNRRGPDSRVYNHVRLAWGIFIGTKGEDLGEVARTQNIGRQMNLYGGINLNKVHRYQTTYPDPPGGTKPLYMQTATLQNLIRRVRTDDTYFKYLYSAEPSSRPLLDLWRDTTGQKTAHAVSSMLELARSMLDAFVNGDGVYNFRYAYWHGGLAADSAAPIVNDLLTVEPISQQMRERLKAASALFGYILWDNDLVPLTGQAGVNLGTANMPVQQSQYRNLYAVLLSELPVMKDRESQAMAIVDRSLKEEISPSGAQRASPHYADASMEPLLDMAQQLKMKGIADLFQSEPLIARFGAYYMNMLTPPEIRFGGIRKLISIGDGSTESSQIYGELATELATAQPGLSAELMGAWQASGKMQSGFHGTTVLKIDDTLPAAPFKLSSIDYPDWGSIMRSGFGTPNESALWFINGNYYSDHRHDDNGSLAFYLLGAPVAIDWGGTYTPHASGPYMHSLVMPESEIGADWNSDKFKLEDGPTKGRFLSQYEGFSSFDHGSHAAAGFERENGWQWNRSVTMAYPDDAHPFVLIVDDFPGAAATQSRVSTLNLMAQDAVITPAGPVVPPSRVYDTYGTRHEMPVSTDPADLPPGENKFQFHGQWGVDWDLYTFSSRPQQFVLSDWGHAWHPALEMAQFQAANKRKFSERQYIFRVRGQGPLITLIVPRRAGGAPAVVTRKGDVIEYHIAGNAEGLLSSQFEAFRRGSQSTLTAFGSGPASAYGMSVRGGPAEISLKYNHLFVAVQGARGRREFHVEGDWVVKPPFHQTAPGVISVDFDGQPLQAVLDPKS